MFINPIRSSLSPSHDFPLHLSFRFRGLAPWIADVAPTQNATIVASSPLFLSSWTDTEIYINQSALIVSATFADSAVTSAAGRSSAAVPLSLPWLPTSAHQPPDETLKGTPLILRAPLQAVFASSEGHLSGNIHEFQLESALKTTESKDTTEVLMSYPDIVFCL